MVSRSCFGSGNYVSKAISIDITNAPNSPRLVIYHDVLEGYVIRNLRRCTAENAECDHQHPQDQHSPHHGLCHRVRLFRSLVHHLSP